MRNSLWYTVPVLPLSLDAGAELGEQADNGEEAGVQLEAARGQGVLGSLQVAQEEQLQVRIMGEELRRSHHVHRLPRLALILANHAAF